MYHVLRFGREIANLALKSANVRTANPPTFGVRNLRKVQKFIQSALNLSVVRIFFYILPFQNCSALLVYNFTCPITQHVCMYASARFCTFRTLLNSNIYLFSNIADWFIYQHVSWRLCLPAWGSTICPLRVVPVRCMFAFKDCF